MGTNVDITLDSGYTRALRRGSRWQSVGRLPQGEVYKPIDSVLTVEGANVHEAYIVVEGKRLVGFYLPVENAFTPISSKPSVSLQE